MRFKVAGNKKDIVAVVVKNGDANSLTAKAGSPLFLQANGTNDGLAIVTAVNLAAASQGTFFGIALTDINPGAFGESCVFGMMESVRLRISTRSATDAVWVSFAAGAVGDNLLPVTGTGVVAASISADQAVSNAGSIAFSLAAHMRLGQTYASATTQASTLTVISGGAANEAASLATAAFTTVKAFIRAM